MSSLEELAQRIAAVEDRLDQEAGLRASVDRDLGGTMAHLRAQTHVINALALTQSEHTAALRDVEQTLAIHTGKLARHEESLTAAHGKLDRIIDLLDRLASNG